MKSPLLILFCICITLCSYTTSFASKRIDPITQRNNYLAEPLIDIKQAKAIYIADVIDDQSGLLKWIINEELKKAIDPKDSIEINTVVHSVTPDPIQRINDQELVLVFNEPGKARKIIAIFKGEIPMIGSLLSLRDIRSIVANNQ